LSGSSPAIQVLDFSVIREKLFDNGNEIAADWVEIVLDID